MVEPTKTLAVTVATSVLAILILTALWLGERARRNANEGLREVTQYIEVPKTDLKTVEVIRTVEVPAKLTERQVADMSLGQAFRGAQYLILSEGEVFNNVESLRVKVVLNDDVKKVTTEDRVRNKFELVLRRQNIQLNDNSPISLVLRIEGLWQKEDKGDLALVYIRELALLEQVTVQRSKDSARGRNLRCVFANTWSSESYGYAGKNVVEKTLLNGVEEAAETFANTYLANKDKRPEAVNAVIEAFQKARRSEENPSEQPPSK